MKVIITFTCCRDNLQKSKFMALEKPGKLREIFSPTLWPPCPCPGTLNVLEERRPLCLQCAFSARSL